MGPVKWRGRMVEIGKVNAFAICSYQNIFRLIDDRFENLAARTDRGSRAVVKYKSQKKKEKNMEYKKDTDAV